MIMQSVTPSLTNPPDHFPEQTQSSTKTAFVEAAKAFGRVAFKMPYAILLTTYEGPSLLTESLTGVVGGTVGILVGSTAILSRKCMGAKARRFFGLENPVSLQDYANAGFHTGARLGELPGRLLGSCAVVALCASSVLYGGIVIPVVLGFTGTSALICSLTTFVSTKCSGVDIFSNFHRNFIQNARLRNLNAHNRLVGIELLPYDSAVFKEFGELNKELVLGMNSDSGQSSQDD